MLSALAMSHAAVLLGAAALGVRRLTGSLGHKLAGMFLLVWGNLILTALGLGLLGQLNHLHWYFACSCALSLCTALASGHRSLGRAADGRELPLGDNSPLRFTPLVLFALVALFLAIVGSVAIAALVYPNNYDTVAYRLPRCFLLLAQGHLGHPCPAADFRINHYPLNGTLGYLFLAVYGLDGRFFNLPSVLCWLMAGVGVWLLAHDIGGSRKGALLAAIVYLLTPVVLVCATSGNDELIAAAPILFGVVFLHRWWHTGRLADALLGALGLGIGLGTKLHWTFFIGYVPLVLTALLWHLIRGRQALRFLRQRGLHLALIALIAGGLSCPFYVINKLGSGYAINPPNVMTALTNKQFRPKQALINTEILTSQLFLSPFPDVLVSTDRARVEHWYQSFNEFLSKGFTWFDTSDDYSPPWYHFRGVAFPNEWERYSELSLWVGFTPWLLLGIVGCLLFARGSRPARVAGWLGLGFFCWHLAFAVITRYMETAGVYYAYPVTIAAASLAILWDVGARRWLLRTAFAVVLLAHVLTGINVFAFNGLRSVAEIVEHQFAAKEPLVDPSVGEALRSAKEVEIVYTEWELQLFHLMTRSPLSRYRVVSGRDPVRPEALRVYCWPASTTHGFVKLRYPGHCASRLTLLGKMNTVYGPENVFGVGDGIYACRPTDNGFLAFALSPRKVVDGRWRGAIRVDPTIHGLAEDEAVELRLEQDTPGERRHLIADWQSPARLAAQLWPIASDKSGSQLRFSVRSPLDYRCAATVFYPLANDHDSNAPMSPVDVLFGTPEDVSIEALGPSNSEGFRGLEGPYPAWYPCRVRWMNAPRARIRFFVDGENPRDVVIHFRAVRTTDSLVVRLNGREVLRTSGPVTSCAMTDFRTMAAALHRGENILEFEAESSHTPRGAEDLRVLFETIGIEYGVPPTVAATAE